MPLGRRALQIVEIAFRGERPPRCAPPPKAICAGTRKRGKIAGVHTDGAKTAIRRFGEGYQLCTILSDARLMANAAAAAVREARGQMAQAGAKTY
jgi:hypothetical protein